MLDQARTRVPDGEFLAGDLHALPLSDNAVDLVVTALALVHVPALAPVLAEFARVLRPGGHLVISDVHYEQVLRGSVVKALGPAGEPGLTATYRHTPGDYLRAALPAGFQVRRCEEPARVPPDEPAPPAPEFTISPWPAWPWSLMELLPEATRAAWSTPPVIIWHFQLAL
jgi:SAM-dependent methyltransferase